MKTKLIVLFMLISAIGYSQADTIFPMPINVGASANDGTGDKVRTAFQKVNANFSDIYGSVISGPVNGTKYTELRKGIKRATVDPQIASYYYYIKTFINGADSGIHHHYKLEIAAASSNPRASGTVIGHWDYYSDSLYTITHRIGFAFAVSPGGISGNLIIDFSELTAGATYTGTNFTQTGIFATSGGLGAASGGGGIGGNIAYDKLARIKIALDTLEGQSSVYYLTNTMNHRIRLDSIRNILQPFTLIMSDSVGDGTLYWTWIRPLAGAKINDRDSIQLFPGENVVIYPDSLEFQAIVGGSYSAMGNGQFYYKKICLDTSQVRQLGTTPYDLIIAPGTGKYIKINSIDFDATVVSGKLEIGSQSLNVGYNTFAYVQIPNALIETASSLLFTYYASYVANYELKKDTKITAFFSSGANSTGGGKVSVCFYIVYQIITL
jgi:hypothetical protein